MSDTSHAVPPSKRLVSLDIQRGMTMLAMMAHTMGLADLAHLPVAGVVYRQLNHADWVGFHFEDFILPSFLFVMGVSMAFSNAKRRERGDTFTVRLKHAAIRSIELFAFGFMLSWLSAGRPVTGPGVLQLLALSYFAGFLFSDLPVRGRFGVFAGLLFVYWFFVFIIPVYDVGRNSYIIYKNLVYLIDETLTNSPSRWGYLYTVIHSGAIVVFGSIAGDLYRKRPNDASFMKRLAALGATGVILGLALHPVIPIIKRMFTGTYTLLTCGMASLALLDRRHQGRKAMGISLRGGGHELDLHLHPAQPPPSLDARVPGSLSRTAGTPCGRMDRSRRPCAGAAHPVAGLPVALPEEDFLQAVTGAVFHGDFMRTLLPTPRTPS